MPTQQGLREICSYRFDGFELNMLTRRLKAPNGRLISLSYGLFNLLAALCAAPRRILTRDQLLGACRGYDSEIHDDSIDCQILRLRRKIEDEPRQPMPVRCDRDNVRRLITVTVL